MRVLQCLPALVTQVRDEPALVGLPVPGERVAELALVQHAVLVRVRLVELPATQVRLLRFDLVYHGHFKCNIRRIADYPNLSGYMRDLYQWPGIADTCNFGHAKRHYYASHDTVNPTGIVPVGPVRNLDAPHGRG